MNHALKHSRPAFPTNGDTLSWITGVLFGLMIVVGLLVAVFARSSQDTMAGLFSVGFGIAGSIGIVIVLFLQRRQHNHAEEHNE